MTISSGKTCRAFVLAVAALMAAGSTLADKPEGAGQGKGKDKHEQKQKDKDKGDKHAGKDRYRDREDVKVGAFFNDGHRNAARAYYAQRYPEGRRCPPGLAKKNNGCMPPGQAKKYNMGQPLPRDVYWYPVPQPVVVLLPIAPPGYRYVRVGNDILLLSPQSALVVDVIQGLLG